MGASLTVYSLQSPYPAFKPVLQTGSPIGGMHLVVKKSLIAVILLYLLGVFGVAGGYLSSEWDGDWSFGAQLFDALKMGATWPLLVIDLIVGA